MTASDMGVPHYRQPPVSQPPAGGTLEAGVTESGLPAWAPVLPAAGAGQGDQQMGALSLTSQNSKAMFTMNKLCNAQVFGYSRNQLRHTEWVRKLRVWLVSRRTIHMQCFYPVGISGAAFPQKISEDHRWCPPQRLQGPHLCPLAAQHLHGPEPTS